MIFVPIEELPENRRKGMNAPIKHYLTEFMRMGVKQARTRYSPGEFTADRYAYDSLRISATQLSLPIDVRVINGEVYLIRRDI